MDDIVHVVASSLRDAHEFADINSIPRDRVKVYIRPTELYGAKFGRFVYFLGSLAIVTDREARWRAEMSGTTVIECPVVSIVVSTWE